MHHHRTILATLAVLGASACGGRDATAPRPTPTNTQSAATKQPAVSAPRASARWHQLAHDLVAQRRIDPPTATRGYALLSVAEYLATRHTRHDDGRLADELQRGAVAGSSAAVMSYLYPAEVGTFEALATEQAGNAPSRELFERGEEIGRDAAATLITRARSDGFDAVWSGQIPVGPGFWISTGPPPLKPLLGSMKPFALASGGQFRPAPPPAFGSPDFLSALAEVRHIADTRTAEQLQSALFWAQGLGSSTTQGYWEDEAARLIDAAALDERRAAQVLAVMDAAAMDALIACYDAKYTYWFLRPIHADPGITLAIPMPSHPSYPSAHSCLSGASARVLGRFFPGDAGRLDGLADAAGLSRLYAGIHYRFDIDVGLGLGRSVARYVLNADRRGGLLHKGGDR